MDLQRLRESQVGIASGLRFTEDNGGEGLTWREEMIDLEDANVVCEVEKVEDRSM